MNLETKICQVQSIFSQLDQEIEELKHSSGLDCRSHCTHCCENPDIEATILEFLPLAKHIYDLGWHERYLHQLAAKPEQCILLNPEQKASQDISLVPGCRMYPYRGIICRLFGFSTREDKFGNPELVACSWLKHAPAYANIFLLGIKIPTIAEYRWQGHLVLALTRRPNRLASGDSLGFRDWPRDATCPYLMYMIPM